VERRDVSIAPVSADRPWDGYRFVFVGGVHRSGTSYTARALATHPGITAFHDTGVQEDEGEHLQSAYPDSWDHGGMRGFAFSPAMHLTERSPLVSDHSRLVLWEEWGRHWDLSRPVLLEKSPPNLLKMRFLQALFPNSGQVLVIRHPISVVLSTLRWRTTLQGLFSAHRVLDHWLAANELAIADAMHVRRLYVLRYEDLIADSGCQLERIATALDLCDEFSAERFDSSREDRNRVEWSRLVSSSTRRTYFRWIERRYEPYIRQFGYSFSVAR
jgi:hypothetical protein